MATSNGSTAIRDKILASLARYRALRIGKFPCAFWRLSSRPGLTAIAVPTGIYSAELIKSYQPTKVSNEACPSCGKIGHDTDADFCKYCGGALDENEQ